MIEPLAGSKGEWARRSELLLGVKPTPQAFWSVDHVSFEAIAAYADGKLGPKPASRAREHFQKCSECAEQLAAQAQARAALRHAECVQVPTNLLGMLAAIPRSAQ
jgi:hypothetical protein